MDTVTFNLYEDLENVADSMLIESNTEIANLETDDYFVSLEVRGEVNVDFTVDGITETFRNPSEFPDELKELIAGKSTPIYDGEEDFDARWYNDDRVYVDANNWFEVFVRDKKTDKIIITEVVDVENSKPAEVCVELLEFVYYARKEYKKAS